MASAMFAFKTENLDILAKAMERVKASLFLGYKPGPEAEKAAKNHFGSEEASVWIGSADKKFHSVSSTRARPFLSDTFLWNSFAFQAGAKQFFKNAINGSSTQSDLQMMGNELVINTRNMVYDGFYEGSIPNPPNVIAGKGPGKPPLIDSGDMMSALTYVVSK